MAINKAKFAEQLKAGLENAYDGAYREIVTLQDWEDMWWEASKHTPAENLEHRLRVATRVKR